MQKSFSAEEILRALKNHYDESIFVTDAEGTVLFLNECAAHRFDATIEELLGKKVQHLMTTGLYQRSTSLESAATKSEVIATINPNSRHRLVSHSVPVLDDKGDVMMVVTNNMDESKVEKWTGILNRERIANQRVRRELDYLRLKDQNPVIAASRSMLSAISKVHAVAPTESNVVLYGESGTGKDVIAHLIHDCSPRAENAFISINCAAIPENLLESELFGHEKGSFTGAMSKGKVGLLEAAQQGDIFLDEIGEMSMSLQSKLLRALENREIRRVGGISAIPIDIRIICATNQDLKKMVELKQFREDLYYRLNVFPIHLPALRERQEDIIPLAEHFLKGLNAKYNTDKYFSDESAEALMTYPWPGNVRELRNVVERSYVINPGNEIQIDLRSASVPEPDGGTVCEAPFPSAESYHTLKEYLSDAEDWFISQTLKKTGGSIGQAAARLGIHRSVLYRKTHKDK